MTLRSDSSLLWFWAELATALLEPELSGFSCWDSAKQAMEGGLCSMAGVCRALREASDWHWTQEAFGSRSVAPAGC